MKTLYIDCGMGAAGDMLTAALLEIVCKNDASNHGVTDFGRVDYAKADAFIKRFHEAGIPGVEMHANGAIRHGITGTRVRVLVNGKEEGEPEPHEHSHHHHHNNHEHSHEYSHEAHCHDREDHGHEHCHEYTHEAHCHDREDHGHEHCHDHTDEPHCHDHEDHGHEHSRDHCHCHSHSHPHVHRSMTDIEAIISGLNIDEEVKHDVLCVYKMIAEAEGQVHGKPAGEVHFHEVGTMDAIADVTAVCMLIHELKPNNIVASPVATGYGRVRCAHGLLPVPAPATAILLQGVPAYAGDVEGELCTPTGAALIKYFANEYSQMPLMKTEAIGYGYGTREFEKANCLRAFYGESM